MLGSCEAADEHRKICAAFTPTHTAKSFRVLEAIRLLQALFPVYLLQLQPRSQRQNHESCRMARARHVTYRPRFSNRVFWLKIPTSLSREHLDADCSDQSENS